jgi:hypothetical protein
MAGFVALPLLGVWWGAEQALGQLLLAFVPQIVAACGQASVLLVPVPACTCRCCKSKWLAQIVEIRLLLCCSWSTRSDCAYTYARLLTPMNSGCLWMSFA